MVGLGMSSPAPVYPYKPQHPHMRRGVHRWQAVEATTETNAPAGAVLSLNWGPPQNRPCSPIPKQQNAYLKTACQPGL